jgi:hypothetical protein
MVVKRCGGYNQLVISTFYLMASAAIAAPIDARKAIIDAAIVTLLEEN